MILTDSRCSIPVRHSSSKSERVIGLLDFDWLPSSSVLELGLWARSFLCTLITACRFFSFISLYSSLVYHISLSSTSSGTWKNWMCIVLAKRTPDAFLDFSLDDRMMLPRLLWGKSTMRCAIWCKCNDKCISWRLATGCLFWPINIKKIMSSLIGMSSFQKNISCSATTIMNSCYVSRHADINNAWGTRWHMR